MLRQKKEKREKRDYCISYTRMKRKPNKQLNVQQCVTLQEISSATMFPRKEIRHSRHSDPKKDTLQQDDSVLKKKTHCKVTVVQQTKKKKKSQDKTKSTTAQVDPKQTKHGKYTTRYVKELSTGDVFFRAFMNDCTVPHLTMSA